MLKKIGPDLNQGQHCELGLETKQDLMKRLQNGYKITKQPGQADSKKVSKPVLLRVHYNSPA